MTAVIGSAAMLLDWEHAKTPESEEIQIIATLFPKVSQSIDSAQYFTMLIGLLNPTGWMSPQVHCSSRSRDRSIGAPTLVSLSLSLPFPFILSLSFLSIGSFLSFVSIALAFRRRLIRLLRA